MFQRVHSGMARLSLHLRTDTRLQFPFEERRDGRRGTICLQYVNSESLIESSHYKICIILSMIIIFVELLEGSFLSAHHCPNTQFAFFSIIHIFPSVSKG